MKRIVWAVLLITGCGRLSPEYTLPIYGEKKITKKIENGIEKIDTIYHTLPDFKLYNQDGQLTTAETYDGKVYVADFFFTSCPTICPLMKSQMFRLSEKFEGDDRVLLLSFSIDPEHDSVAVLKQFANNIGIESSKWNLLTGNKDSIFSLAQGEYLVTAKADASEPGGYIHSGAFILVDPKRRIRGYYDGTKETEVNKLMSDIRVLLNE